MMTQMTPQRLLVLTGPNSNQGNLLQVLRQSHTVVVAETMEQALDALRSGEFDMVFSDAADFLPLERAIATQQSGLILDTIGEGICITDESGHILWANRRMKQWSEQVRQRICQVCSEAFAVFANQVGPMVPNDLRSQMVGKAETDDALHVPAAAPPAAARSKRFAFHMDEAQYFELLCSPVVDAQRRVSQVVAICWDATSGRRLQQKIDAIDQSGRELVQLESEAISKLNVGQRLKLLEEKIIRFSRQLMHFDHFAIRLLDRRTNKLELVISVGMPTEADEVELFSEAEGNGISGYVCSTGRSYICPDVEKDPRYIQGLHQAKSSLTVPLMLHHKKIGVFNIESARPAAFTEDDRQFAEIFGRYVAVALNILDLLVVERYETSGQLAKNVTGEISGPLNDIVSDTQILMDEYIGNEDMRKRLLTVIENCNKIRQCVKEVTEGPKTIIGAAPDGPRPADPLLDGRRILVADDEPNIRQTIADLLARFGCVVDMACDGAEAMALLASNARYDLVLSDIKMPHKNGYEIFAAASKLNHSPPVILMTGFGYDPAHSIVRASQEGLAAVLFKPFKVDQLMGEIRKAISAGSK